MAKKSYVNSTTWGKYTNILNNFMESDAAKKKIIWKRYIEVPTLYGEDTRKEPFDNVEIEVLFAYNTFRTWPINVATASGELDNNNVVFYISKNYLEENGYLNSEGYFDFNRSMDRFIMDGITFKSSGDTSASQASDHDVLIMVILKREERVTQELE